MIDITKKYRLRNGSEYRFLEYFPDNPEDSRILGVYRDKRNNAWVSLWSYESGEYVGNCSDLFDLIEEPSLENLKIDDKVIVWYEEGKRQYRRHFAGISPEGKIMCFDDGRTSFTNEDNSTTIWKNWKLPEDSE